MKVISINDIRLPEELKYVELLKSHLMAKQIKKINPEVITRGRRRLDLLNKDGVKIVKSSRPDIIENIENSFLLFGEKLPAYEVFGIKILDQDEFGEAITEENATAFFDEGTLIIVFVHDLLKSLEENEIRYIVGHEIGHFLLGHLSEDQEMAQIEWLINEMEKKGVKFSEIQMLHGILSQIRELSADRAGLLISQNLDSAIFGLAKLAGGFISEKISIQAYINQAKDTPPNKKDAVESHPYNPHRSWALAEFYESDIFMKYLGREGGTPLSEFSKLLPRIVPLHPEGIIGSPISPKEEQDGVNDFLLEISLYNDLFSPYKKITPAEEKAVIESVPVKWRRKVFQKWENEVKERELKADEEIEKIVTEIYKKAALKGSEWKEKVIKRMIKIVKSVRRMRQEQLDIIVNIAEEIEARNECTKQFMKEFGFDPFLK